MTLFAAKFIAVTNAATRTYSGTREEGTNGNTTSCATDMKMSGIDMFGEQMNQPPTALTYTVQPTDDGGVYVTLTN